MLSKNSPRQDYLILGIIWLINIVVDRLWIWLDHAPPSWDQAHHLTGSLNYFHHLQNSHLFSSLWWQELWMLSSKNPPLTYILTAPFYTLFGKGEDSALGINILASGLLLLAVYHLGKHLFSPKVGLLAAAISVVIPELYYRRIDYLIDYPLTAMTVTSFWCLTVWQNCQIKKRQWRWTVAFGVTLGLGMLIKQSILFFLFFPLLWLILKNIYQGRWLKITQLIVSIVIAIGIAFPWYSTNWIFVLGNYQGGIENAAIREGDPPINTLAAWLLYGKELPETFSWVLLIAPCIALGLFIFRVPKRNFQAILKGLRVPPLLRARGDSLLWLIFYCFCSYLIFSAFVNKDSRYIMPYLPILGILCAYCLNLAPQWWQNLKWVTLGLSLVLMLGNLFPLGGDVNTSITQFLSPKKRHYPYQGEIFPHADIIRTITQSNPQLKATLGILTSTGQLNHNNLNYYGALADFQVYGREIGVREKQLGEDARNLDWFVIPEREQGNPDSPRFQLIQMIKNSPDFAVVKTWTLPDGSHLFLYRRNPPPIAIQPVPQMLSQVRLDRVTIPPKVAPGKPVPVTYQWSGPWTDLKSGIILLTWRSNTQKIIHDRAIARGELFEGENTKSYQITESLALLPPANSSVGTYTLTGIYLDRNTGKTYPLQVPPVPLTIAPNSPTIKAPPVDFVSELRELGKYLGKGIEGLTPIFDRIGEINQYDPVQDYTQQAEIALLYRLQQEPNNVDYAYSLALAQVLQEDKEGAIEAFSTLTQLQPKNPYTHAYLAFAYLYSGQVEAAQNALKPALIMAPNLLEVRALHGLISLWQGNLIKAWAILNPIIAQGVPPDSP